MKIVTISFAQIPSDRANSIQVMKMCQAMTQMGHEVNLLVPEDSAQSEKSQSWDELAPHYGIKTRFDIQWLPLNSFWGRRGFTWKALRRARELKADLIYVRALPPAVLGLIQGFPVVLEMHEMPSGCFGPCWYRLFLVLKGKKRLVPISQALNRTLEEKYHSVLPSESVVVAPSGVDIERFKDLPEPVNARQALGLRPGPTAVCTGHLYAGRGMEFFLKLAEQFPEIHFLWVGGQTEEVSIWRELVGSLNLQNVTFTGFIPNEKMPLYQAAGDFLLIPYHLSISGSGGRDIARVSSPMKLFEYLAAGRAIISSDLPVLREVLNEHNAVLCPADDLHAWVQALKGLLVDPEKWISLARQAKQDAGKYKWTVRCQRIFGNFPVQDPHLPDNSD